MSNECKEIFSKSNSFDLQLMIYLGVSEELIVYFLHHIIPVRNNEKNQLAIALIKCSGGRKCTQVTISSDNAYNNSKI